MNKLKVIFANRKECFEKPGGDTVQMMKTKEYLETFYPVEIKICLNPQEILKNEDAKIVHIFNLETINETNDFIAAAKKTGKKVALSTINWDYSDLYFVKYLSFIGVYDCFQILYPFKNIIIKLFNFFLKTIYFDKFENYISKGMYGTKEYFQKRINAINNADLLLPNSDEEAQMLLKEYKINKDALYSKLCIVPNAIEYKKIPENKGKKYPDLNNFVLEVGRIEPTKNQMGVVKALYNNPEIQIVFIGKVQDKQYFENLKKLSQERGNVHILSYAPYEDILELYNTAVCHILPSFKETTGLVSLEALISGCQIVVASEKYCPVEYYEFDKYAFICDPYDVESVKMAVLQAFYHPKDIVLPKEYTKRFSYENVAKRTYEAYKRLGIE